MISSEEPGSGVGEGQRTEMAVQQRSPLFLCIEDTRSCRLPRRQVEMMSGQRKQEEWGWPHTVSL